ncbi:hypothetical protein PG987_004861 [Apiospora arundinis]
MARNVWTTDYRNKSRSESILSSPPIVTTVSAHAVTSIVAVAVAFARFRSTPKACQVVSSTGFYPLETSA